MKKTPMTLAQEIERLETDIRAVNAARDLQLQELANGIAAKYTTDWLPNLSVSMDTKRIEFQVPRAQGLRSSVDIEYTQRPFAINTYSVTSNTDPEYARMRLVGVIAAHCQNGELAAWLLPQLEQIHARWRTAMNEIQAERITELRAELETQQQQQQAATMQKFMEPGVVIQFRKPTTITKRWDEFYNQVERIAVSELRGKRVVVQIQKRHGEDQRTKNIQIPILRDRFETQLQKWIATDLIA